MGEDLLKSAYDAAAFRKEGHRLVDLLADYLDAVQSGGGEKVIEWMDPGDATT